MEIIKSQQSLERLASLLRSESRSLLSEYSLLPIQFEALYYLSISNRYSDTPKAVTEFLGQTKGTVSQTLKLLEKKALIRKLPDTVDKRVVHLKVTREGMKILKKLRPSQILETTCEQMTEDEFTEIDYALTQLLSRLQEANQFKTFGQCFSCIHNIKVTENQFLCNLTKEPLSKNEISLICREHLPADQ